tara:strand:- start:5777 stop:6742 length:966 start_codon:yes stop_codon:yes gene_type:complete
MLINTAGLKNTANNSFNAISFILLLIALALSVLSGYLFFLFDAEILKDKDTYISLINNLRYEGFVDNIFLFNGIEVLSFLIIKLALISFNDAVLGLSLICALSTFIILLSAIKQKFIFLCFTILIFLNYLDDFWLNQIRASLGLAIFISLFLNKSNLGYILAPFFHFQLLFFSIIKIISKYGLLALSLIFFFILAIFFNVFLEYFESIFSSASQNPILEKLIFYLGYEGFGGSYFMYARVVFFALVSSYFIFYKNDKSVESYSLFFSGLVYVVFNDLTSFVGRMASMVIFIEPVFVSRFNIYVKCVYITFLILGALIKNFL